MNFIKSCYGGIANIMNLGEPKSSTGSPLPRNQHMQIALPSLKKRLVIIGDVHGCLDELKRLLEKVDYHPATTTVILVGDMIAKGPHSLGVIPFVRSHMPSFFAVRGNHEDNALLARQDPRSKYGKKKEYEFVPALSEDDIDFIRELPVTISIPELELAIVHAGLNPKKIDLFHQEFSDLIRIRCIDNEGNTTKENPMEGHRRLWGGLYQGPPYIVFGHDAKRKLQVHPWARGLDTGCVYGGALSALVINDTRDTHKWIERAEIVSVPASRVYCAKDED